MYGPIDYIVVGFRGNKFNGEILGELEKVVDKGLIRIVDLAFIMKDVDGDVEALELSDMPKDVARSIGPRVSKSQRLLSTTDMVKIGDALEPDTAAGILVFEHLWAKDFKQSLINANGKLLMEGRVHPDDVEASAKAHANKSAVSA